MPLGKCYNVDQCKEKILILSVFLLFCHPTFAQQTQVHDPSFRHIALKVTSDSVFLDSLSLVPGSLQVVQEGKTVDSSACYYNYSTGYLHLAPRLSGDSLYISYRTLPFGLHTLEFHKSLSLYDSNAFFNVIRYEKSADSTFKKEELFSSPNLTKSGSISRGISMGNHQNIFVNADLNLQMEGALTEDINIRAAITDQNIPLQPEGNTQQLQNFDNVFMELYNEHGSLTAGDVVLQNPGSALGGTMRNSGENALLTDQKNKEGIRPYFLRYRRNVQGGLLKSRYGVGTGGEAETTAGVALAKGRFASVSLQVQEGMQGPYRFKSPENQQFAGLSGVAAQQLNNAYYILANTEKVYLDGQLLRRGYDQDYVMDYNLGEITFTTNVLLTRSSRVNVDFEYADRSYSRRVLTAGHQQEWGRFTFYTRFFQEKDNPNQTLGFTLSDAEKELLSLAGDHLTAAYIPAVDSVGSADQDFSYPQNRNADVPGVGNLYEVLYIKKDTVVAGKTYPLYVFTGKGDGVFKLSFTYLGEGKGNYRLDRNSVNGKVFVWIAPENGQPQGAYEPVRLLSTPQSRQMLVSGLQVRVNGKDKVFGEGAIAHHDLNTFSSLDAKDDQGSALTLGYESAARPVEFLPDYTWSGRLQYEYVQRNFTTIDPYRDIEFERNWSILPPSGGLEEDTLRKANDQLLYLQCNIEKDNLNRFAYRWTGRDRGDALQGGQHWVEARQTVGKWRLRSDWFHMQGRQPGLSSAWNRLEADIHYNKKQWVPGYAYRLDKNQVAASGTDSTVYAATNFTEHQVYLRSADSLENKFRVDYAWRTNFLPLAGKLWKTDVNQTVSAMTDLRLQEHQQLKFRLTYRHTQVANDSAWNLYQVASAQENMVMGMADWHGSFFQNILQTNWNYAIANGRELKREFVYVHVPVGEGSFTWRDDNGNGIEEIEEFYEARYWDERNYVRVYATTNEYVIAFTNQLNWQMNVQFPAQWLREDGLKKWVARFSNSTAWNISKKLNDARLNQRLNPWASIPDEHLLYVRETLRSTIFFNRQSTRLGMDVGIRMNRRKQLLNGGFEERSTKSIQWNTRLNFSRLLGLQMATARSLDYSHLDLTQLSNTANGRNFLIRTYQVAPEIAWQPQMNLRISGKYDFTNKRNQQEVPVEQSSTGGEVALLHTIGCDFRWSRLLSSTLNATTEYIHIRYTGDPKNPISYEMLDALQPGNNARWTISWQQKLWEGLQLTMNYQGRKSPAQPVIHSGSMMVRALF